MPIVARGAVDVVVTVLVLGIPGGLVRQEGGLQECSVAVVKMYILFVIRCRIISALREHMKGLHLVKVYICT